MVCELLNVSVTFGVAYLYCEFVVDLIFRKTVIDTYFIPTIYLQEAHAASAYHGLCGPKSVVPVNYKELTNIIGPL